MQANQNTNDHSAESKRKFVLSPPPEDEVQNVQVVDDPSVAAAASGGNGQAASQPEFVLSEPPEDTIQSVQVVGEKGETPEQQTQAFSEEETPAGASVNLKEADYTDILGEEADPEQPVEPQAERMALTNPEIYRIVREVATAHSGDALYSAVSANREFTTAKHPAHQKRQFGLGFGLLLFTQESGRLGEVLRLMQQRDAAAFSEIFGEHAQTLLEVTNAATPEERLQPVNGKTLWSSEWLGRFRRAGEIEAFQNAQNEAAIEKLFRPMLDVVGKLGVASDRGLAMAFDCVIARGLGGGLRRVVQAVGPLRTAMQRQHALQMLGYEKLTDFQAAAGVTQSGVFAPQTHASLVAALREQGAAALPIGTDHVCRLLAGAKGAARTRLLRLRDSTNLKDVFYAL